MNLDSVKAQEVIVNSPKTKVNNKSKSAVPTTMIDHFTGNKVQASDKYKEFRKLLAEFIAHGAFPVAIVDNPSFRELLVKLCPTKALKFPSVRTVTRDLKSCCSNEETNYRAKLRHTISSQSAPIALTLDLSTGRNSASYYCITAHFIDMQFRMYDELLDLKKFDVKHSAENIQGHVMTTVTELMGMDMSVDKTAFSKVVTSISADCAYNNNFLDKIENVQRIRCFAHRLNTLGKTLPFIVNTEEQPVSVDEGDGDNRGEVILNENEDQESVRREKERNMKKKEIAKDFATFVSCVVKFMNRLRKAPLGNERLRSALFAYQKSKPPITGKYSRTKGPIQGAATRWTYGPKYLRRALELIDDMSHVLSTDNLHQLLDGDKYNWEMHTTVLEEFTQCQQKRSILGYFMELFQRMEFWLLMTEGTSAPTSSIVLHALQDIEGLIDELLDQLVSSHENLVVTDITKQYYVVPIKVFEEFKVNFSNVFKDDMKFRKDNKQVGYNQQFFADNPVLKAAKLLDIRFCYIFRYVNDGSTSKLVPFAPVAKEFDFIFDLYTSHCHKKSVVTEAKSEDNSEDDDEDTSVVSFDLDTDVTSRNRSRNIGTQNVDGDKILFDNEVTRYREAIKILAKNHRKDCGKIMNSNPLQFWKENHLVYPMLSAVARGVLAVPAQSASSERVFSKMTSLISSSRSSLTAEFGAMLISSAFRFKSSSFRDEDIKESTIRKKIFKKNIDNEMIFPPFRMPARDLKYIDYDLLEQEQDEDWVPTNDDEADDDDYDDDDLSVASGDLELLPRNHLKRPNQGQNASLSDIYETATNTGKDSNSTGTMNKKQRRST